jgi:hypothetical protein
MDLWEADDPTDMLDDYPISRWRDLLGTMTWHGLLDPTYAEEKRSWLERWQMTHTLGFFDAAQELRRYLHSPERYAREEVPLPPEDLTESLVSLAWFRHPSPPPEGMAPYHWLSLLEHMLSLDLQPGTAPDPKHLHGEFLLHLDDCWYRVIWRCDNLRTPAVFSAERTD